jgi:hypothetical protein
MTIHIRCHFSMPLFDSVGVPDGLLIAVDSTAMRSCALNNVVDRCKLWSVLFTSVHTEACV